jgi:predicted O-methyltransferase YrrM
MLRWVSDEELVVDDTRFLLSGLRRFPSTSEAFCLLKTRPMVERYVSFLERLRPDNILEIGIAQGGSTVLLALVAHPTRLVSIDLADEPVVALEEYVRTHGLHESVDTFYGVDQADEPRLLEIVEQEFSGEPIDLVIDDASHELQATRDAFATLFPRLRAGGRYVIEDWAWAHTPGIEWLVEPSARQSPAALILDLIELAFTGEIDEMAIDPAFACLERGPAMRGHAPLASGNSTESTGTSQSATDNQEADTELQWISDDELVVNGTHFFLQGAARATSTAERICLWKDREMLERYVPLIHRTPARNIVDLGIYEGGSTVLLAELLRPDKLVAVDIRPEQEVLTRHLDARGFSESVRTYYDVNQGDQGKLTNIVEQEFRGELIDLVVDDASHLLAETRSSFNVLFPRLREGGLYVIEDWAWSLVPGVAAIPPFKDTEPLVSLVFELVMACPSVPGLIDEITVDTWFVCVRRGKASVDPTQFDISTCYAEPAKELLSQRSA